MSAEVGGLESPASALLVFKDFASLTKPRLSAMVVFTTTGGLWLAGAAASMGASRWLSILLATAGVVGAGNAFNCYLERDSDRLMPRTRTRPLPAGRLQPGVALAFAWSLAAVSLPLLAIAANLLTAALGALALYAYVFAYTPLKKRSRWAMVVGAVPGALPALMGWTAARGRIELPGLALFAILFFWQLPHFIAIALFRKEEYRAAGLTSLPLERGDGVARAQAVGYLVALFVVSLLPFWLGVAGPAYLAVAVVLGLAFLGLGVHGWAGRRGLAWARQLFVASLVYLTGLFAALGAGA